MSYINNKQNIKIQINVNDTSGEFKEYWKFAIKKQLKNYTVILTSKNKHIQLSLLNLTLCEKKDYVKNDFCLFNINVLKINSEKDIEGNDYMTFKDNISDNDVNVILIDVEKGDENSLKTSMKLFNIIKKELNNNNATQNNLSFIPKYTVVTGMVYSKIELFLHYLNSKLNAELNNRFNLCEIYFNDTSIDQITSSLNDTYQYISYQNERIKYLSIFNLWNDLQNICSDDLCSSFKVLNQNNLIYNEPHYLNDSFFTIMETKLHKKTITNIDYQQFLIYHYIKSCIYLNQYDLINEFISKLSSNLLLYTANFESMFHLYFWIYLLLDKILQYIQNISISYNEITSTNKENLIYSQNTIYLLMKQILKNYAGITGIEIPTENIFSFAINYSDYDEILNEITTSLDSENEDMEQNIKYQHFVNDIKSICNDNKIYLVFIIQRNFLEEYLSLLININKIYVELKYVRQSVKVLFESLPIFFVLGNLEEVRNILTYLLNCSEIQEHKWMFIKDLIQLMFILVIHCSDKTFKNLTLLLEFIDKPFYNENMLKRFILKNEKINIKNLPYDILNSFITKYNEGNTLLITEPSNQMNTFNLNKLINISFEKDTIFCNNNNLLEFKLCINNKSAFYFEINNVILKVIERMSSSIETKNYIIIEGNIIDDNNVIIDKFVNNEFIDITLTDIKYKFVPNILYQVKEIIFKHKNNVYGSYVFDTFHETATIQYKTFDMECYSKISCCYNTETNIEKETDFYYNTVLSLNISILNIDINSINDENMLEITIEQETPDNRIQILQNLICEHSLDLSNKNKLILLFCDIKQKIKNNLLLIPLVVENTSYNKSLISEYIKITISYNDKINNSLHSYIQFHQIIFKHLLSMKMHFTNLNKDTILMQIELQSLLSNEIILYCDNYINDENQNEEEILSNYNYVLSFKNDDKNIADKIYKKLIKCSVLGIEYLICFPLCDILKTLKGREKCKKYKIEIEVINNQKEIYVMDELNVKIILRNNTLDKNKILFEIKDNSSWIIVNKNKFISVVNANSFCSYIITIIPLTIGYINFPEINLYEFELTQDNGPIKINNSDIQISSNINFIEINSKTKNLVRTNII